MYCRNCGKEIDEQAAICVACGYKNGDGENYCYHCGASVNTCAKVCLSCGYSLEKKNDKETSKKSKLTAGLLGIFLGGLGIHNFYLGYTGKAVAQIVLSLCTAGVGSIWGLIEGILILCGKIDKDANGATLTD